MTVIVQKIPVFGYQSYDAVDLANVNSADYKAEFRVYKAPFLALQMPYILPQCSIGNRDAFVKCLNLFLL